MIADLGATSMIVRSGVVNRMPLSSVMSVSGTSSSCSTTSMPLTIVCSVNTPLPSTNVADVVIALMVPLCHGRLLWAGVVVRRNLVGTVDLEPADPAIHRR